MKKERKRERKKERKKEHTFYKEGKTSEVIINTERRKEGKKEKTQII